MTDVLVRDVLLFTSLMLQLVGLTFAVMVDSFLSRGKRKVMLLVAAFVLSLIVFDYTSYLLEWRVAKPFARTLISIYCYSVRPLILGLLIRMLEDGRRMRPVWALIGANALVHVTALFSGICFGINAANTFYRGPLGYCCHAVSAVLLIHLGYLSLRGGNPKKRGSWVLVFNELVILAATAMDTLMDLSAFPISLLTTAMVSCCVFYYIWLHLQFVLEHERDLQAEQRIQIMMSQIQPHFLYNTISTIRALCRSNPDKAGEVAEKFGIYLRRNLNSLGNAGTIPFLKELEHTKLYVEIEMVRFDNIRVEYDIRDVDFRVPALSLQPMVENAIRHGIRIREEGIVRVSTRRTENTHELVIRDNGCGFDTASLVPGDGNHIGIRNVRERVESMCGGSFLLESRIGEGTTVTIRIPAEKEEIS